MKPSDPGYISIHDFNYDLPDHRIARYPVSPRDASRLLVYQAGRINDSHFRHLGGYLPATSVVVFNQTRVIHARLLFRKKSGGVVEVFCLEPDHRYPDVHTAMHQTGQAYWQCLVGGAKKWKHGTVLSMRVPGLEVGLEASVVSRTGQTFTILLEWNSGHTFAEILHHAGQLPIPPYLGRPTEQADEQNYQPVYARDDGSVAAPTAGLHFSSDVLDGLRSKGITEQYVTLHVGAGTFMPVKSETIAGHEMHAEWMEVSRATVNLLLERFSDPVVAVGTTAMRTLESLYHIGNKLANGKTPDFGGNAVGQWDPYNEAVFAEPLVALAALTNYMEEQQMVRLVTKTQILIAPGYVFRIVSGLITNFHQPQSTLLLLIAAFIGDDWKNVYAHALEHGYRFLSYGDSSLLWGHETRDIEPLPKTWT